MPSAERGPRLPPGALEPTKIGALPRVIEAYQPEPFTRLALELNSLSPRASG